MATANATKQSLAVNTAKTAVSADTSGKSKFSSYINTPNVQASILNTLGDLSRTKSFTASLITAVTNNPDLQKCDAVTVISAALFGESLNLSSSPQLGHYHIVPFRDHAVFVLGWKGYYQLALRSGVYEKLHATEIKEGEVVRIDPIYEEYEFKAIKDPAERLKAPTVGYYAFYKTLDGFRKEIYLTKAEMEHHALQYSNGYRSDKEKGTKYTFWSKDFDSMALKTMFRQLIGKYGLMSTELETAFKADMSAGGFDESEREYVDNMSEEDL